MKFLFRKLISVGLATLALAPMLAGGASPAAAATVVYVDDGDTNNNQGIACPNPVASIQLGVDALPATGGTVNVCPGTYTAGASITNKDNVKLIAKGTVTVTPPANFSGPLFEATQGSNNITIQGFIIDGGSTLHPTIPATAIGFFLGSSGSVVKNVITHWHQPSPNATTRHLMIFAENSGPIKITNNTLYDFSGVGIHLILNTAPPTITRNQIIFSGAGGFPSTGILIQGVTGGAITSNTIRSDHGFHATTGDTVGIKLLDAGGIKIKSNSIIAILIGLLVSSECTAPPHHASNNQITGNRLYDNKSIGISIRVLGCSGFADDNKVTGNKVYFNGLHGGTGISVGSAGLGASVDGNVVKGNTIAGYNIPVDATVGTTNTIDQPNKVLPVPPPGA